MTGIPIIKEFEGCKLKAYLCPANKWTIGYGSCFYEDGKPVKSGDVITQERAEALLANTYQKFERGVKSLVTSAINANQLGALTSFAFNVGLDIDADTIPEGLGDSRLLVLVNRNSSDPMIRAEFNKWVNGGGRVLPGLVRRRKAEADLYYKPI